ncbi:MAG: cation:proton antiporter domain-containing protein [Thermoguttaceae bacterium]
MGELTSADLTVFLLGLSVLLGSAHVCGEISRRLGQPAVVGEMLAGLAFGPSCLGWFAPEFQGWLFPQQGSAAVALNAVVILAVTLLLLVAGMEVDLSTVWRQGKAALWVGLAGLVVPLSAGFLVAWAWPQWLGIPAGNSPPKFALFFGVALSVSALPVIAKILMDQDLFKTDFGMLALVSATVNNLLAWLLFAILVGADHGGPAIHYLVGLTVAMAIFFLTGARWAIDKALPWVQAHLVWPGGVLGFVLVVGLTSAAMAEAVGIHAIFGAFLAGIALGDSPHLREHVRHVVYRFVEGILAPIFVTAIGLKVNFVSNFHPDLVLGVLLLGTAVKLLGCSWAARAGGVRGVEAWAIGWAMNTRGELGIVLGLLAWEAGLIGEPLFVALVVLALVSSGAAGPMLKRLLQRERTWSLSGLLDARACASGLTAASAGDVIGQLGSLAAERASLDCRRVVEAVLERESLMGTGLGHGVAVPHARLTELRAPVVVAGTVPAGVRFEATDDEPVRLVFLILTPEADPVAQIQILRGIAHLCQIPRLREDAIASQSPTALLAALRIAGSLEKSSSVEFP